MKKVVIAAAAIALSLVSTQAFAGGVWMPNGTELNGTKMNGTKMNGTKMNGTKMNGTTASGMQAATFDVLSVTLANRKHIQMK